MHVCDEESVDIKELISRLSIWKHKKKLLTSRVEMVWNDRGVGQTATFVERARESITNPFLSIALSLKPNISRTLN